jgi:hypothetical protein
MFAVSSPNNNSTCTACQPNSQLLKPALAAAVNFSPTADITVQPVRRTCTAERALLGDTRLRT